MILQEIRNGTIINYLGKTYIILSIKERNGYYECLLSENFELDIIPEKYNGKYIQPENCTIKDSNGQNIDINAEIKII